MFNDCRRYDMRDEACQDYVVAIIAPRNEARHLEAEELRALSVLADAGLVPPLRPHSAPDRPEQAKPQLRKSPPPRTWAYPATKAS